MKKWINPCPVRKHIIYAATVFCLAITAQVHSQTIEKDSVNPFLANRAKGEWTLLVIPDTQTYTDIYDEKNKLISPIENMNKGFDWIVSMKEALNIKMVQGLGDITQDGDQDYQWKLATENWYKLIGTLPAIPNQGNHDNAETFKKAFPVNKFNHETWWGGNFDGMLNTYQLMTIGEVKYLFANIRSYDPWGCFKPDCDEDAPINWLNDVIAKHPDHKVILATHDTWERSVIKDRILTQHDPIIMSNAGHSCVREAHYKTKGPKGGISQNFVTDYQCTEGIMNLRYYIFRPLENIVDFYTYSPVTGQFETDANSQGSFSLEQKTIK